MTETIDEPVNTVREPTMSAAGTPRTDRSGSEARVEHAQCREPAHRGGPGDRVSPQPGEQEQQCAAGGQLPREQGEGRDVVDDLLGGDGAESPAGGSGGQVGGRGS
jgi:hypothetical protein